MDESSGVSRNHFGDSLTYIRMFLDKPFLVVFTMIFICILAFARDTLCVR